MIKVGYRGDLSRDEAVDLAARSIWEAADTDSATGGPDALRGIYPVVAAIDARWMGLDLTIATLPTGTGELSGRSTIGVNHDEACLSM